MNELNKYLKDLQDEEIIHRDVKAHILFLVKRALNEEIAIELNKIK